MAEKTIEIIVELGDDESQRLDKYLGDELADFSRARIQKLIDEEKIRVNGKVEKASFKLNGGEKIELLVPEQVPLDLVAEDIPLDILFEDEHLIVINKQAGLITHPGAGVRTGTLVNALLHHCQSGSGTKLSGISGVERPGIVHRLDKDTSGLMVVAKDDKAHWSLQEQIRAKSARRVYMGLLEGSMKLDSGTVDKPIGRHPSKRRHMAIVEGGRNAVSSFEVISRWQDYTLVKVALETGRTHQIRVHMASLGHPVVGDLIYGDKATKAAAKRERLGLLGHALHAAYLSFMHPVSKSLLEFTAPPPADFQKAMESFGKPVWQKEK